MKMNNVLERQFVRQHDSSDCGVACLLSLTRYYGGDAPLEALRELSGTGRQGTTMLGLFQAAKKMGFDAEGCEAEGVHSLIEHGAPTVLHVLIDGHLQHYVVWYSARKTSAGHVADSHVHLIGDPARGIIEMTTSELSAIWVSKKCLTLSPNSTFQKSGSIREQRREWLFSLIREDIPLLVSAGILGLFITALGMVMVVFSQKLIDQILPNHDTYRLVAGFIMVGVLLLGKVGFEMLRNYLLLRQTNSFNNRIIGKFYNSLLLLPKRFFDNRKTGDLVARMNDTSRIQKVISQLAGQVLIDLMVVFVSTGFLLYYSWQVGVGLLVTLPAYFLIIYRFHRPIRHGQKQAMAAYAMSESNYINTLQGLRAIKAFNRQEQFGQHNSLIYGMFQERVLDLGKVQLRLNAWAGIAGVLLLMSILVYTSTQVLAGVLKPGELIAILGLSSSLLPAVTNLALLAVPISEARVAFDRMFEFVGLSPEFKNPPASSKAFEFESIEMQGVTFRFPGRPALLQNLTLSVKKGEIIGVTGESGCGKSTLIQLIECFYQPEGGRILVNGSNDLTGLSIPEWRSNVACVPQEVTLFNGTLLDNLLMGKQTTTEEIRLFFTEEPLLLPFVSTLPHGLDTLIGEEGQNLSGGQKQWVGLLRALFQRPRLLLLDEATSAMDSQGERAVMELLQKLRNRMGIIYVSHRLHTLPRICNRIYVLEKGNVIASGNHSELLLTDNLYSQFWKELGLN